MLLSNQKIEYPPVRRVPNVKLTGQNPSSTTVTTPTSVSMPTSTSLQDISSHAQKFTWTTTNDNNNNNNNKDPRLCPYPVTLVRTKPSRQLTTSQSDERIFEHPEVTIKPSALDDELQRRLVNLRTSNPTENVLEQDARQSAPNILEHPDMRTPVVMQSQQPSSSSSSSAILIHTDCKRVSRTQSADAYTAIPRTPSPGKRVEFFIDNNQPNPKRSLSPGSGIADIIESPEHEKDEDITTFPRSPRSATTTTTTISESIGEYSKPRSKSDDNRLNTNDS